MRVQPHLPSNPLVAMVTSRSGSALSACSAANNPAPPEPRIKMSVARRSTAMRASKHTRQQDKGDDRRDCRRDGRQLFLPMVPSEILDQEHAHASQHVHHEQKDEATFGDLHQRLLAPAQKIFERGFAFDCKPKRQEVKRKENRKRQAGEPVHERGDPKHALAVSQYGHGSTTATTARAPRRKSSTPNAPAKMPASRDLTGDHSASTLRTPIAA